MIKILAAATLSFAAGFALTCAIAAVPDTAERSPLFEVIATDSSGDAYVAGSGDDCRAAWESAVLPSDWREIICIQVSR